MRALALPLLLAASPALASPSAMECSAHFSARAEWMEVMGADPVAVDRFSGHADRLLAWHEAQDIDPEIVVGMDPHHHRDERAALALDLLTGWAEDGRGSGPLPLCMEDPVCNECTRMIRRLAIGGVP